MKMTPPPEIDDEGPPELRRVTGPANALIVVALLGLILNGVLLIVLQVRRQQPASPPPRPEGMSDADYRMYQSGQTSAPLLEACGLGVPTLIIYPLALLAASRMKKLQSHRLAMTSAILVMLPCSPAFLFGIPVGLWAVMVLQDEGVKRAFERTARRGYAF
jgi:hypothetical protein